ncbi:polysaccharide pyruvyl transferase family protein [Gordonia amicalis]|uniref:polysaccharide pyruvyl transferase family protein n=1 Tax=Gordonia amicalis TaxID=89053 RepID=UPI0024BBD331|nr:polysaccharide pyruvyl transferase family protein [Gordonia amicalis]MDJ0455414.1 polysaccharide pyruvyl transferase family protein [Gordonia amicalis]MDV7078740.1 polysaccharide pyruvyl transferase family protein [Gordonia amicalis]
MESALDIIQNRTLRVLAELLPHGTKAALVDFPSHENAGDSLIYAGEVGYFRRLGVSIDYICDVDRYRPEVLRARVPEGPVLLHGGGNFGDRWPRYQKFREQVIADFPDRAIVMLPQSMEFESADNLEAVKALFGQHPNLTIMLREQRSFTEALDHFGGHNPVVYCPDLAFGYGARRVHGKFDGRVEVTRLLRQDSEKIAHGSLRTSHSYVEYDWGLRGLDRVAWRAIRIPGRVAATVPATGTGLYPMLSSSYRAQAGLNLWRASKMLSVGRVVVTDRLHAAVLGGLLGMPVVALDNSYGKISSVFDDYLHTLNNVSFASSAEEAVARIYELLP